MYIYICISIDPARHPSREGPRLNCSSLRISKYIVFQRMGTPNHQMFCSPRNRDSRSPNALFPINAKVSTVERPKDLLPNELCPVDHQRIVGFQLISKCHNSRQDSRSLNVLFFYEVSLVDHSMHCVQ